jgi:hypothetical protein
LLGKTRCDQVHASLRSRRHDLSLMANPRVSFNTPSPLPDEAYESTDLESVVRLRAALQRSL